MIPVFVYQIFVVWLAYDNAKRIGLDKKIHHWLNGTLHILAAVIVFKEGWNVSLALLFTTKAVFDTMLNFFRMIPNPLNYLSPEVKKIPNLWMALMKGKFVDYIEYKIFGNNLALAKAAYITISCLALVL